MTEPATTMDITEIMSVLPHRYPFLLIDRIIEMERRKRVVAIKNVTANEPHFTGHFPNFPIMPGVLVIEAIAQAGGALLLTEYSEHDRETKLMVFTGINDAKFRKPVVPGDRVEFHMTRTNQRRNIWWYHGKAMVDGAVVAEAEISAMIITDADKQG